MKAGAREVFRRLRERYPDTKISLHFTSPLQLLVATILSAQCTDERVNKVTASLFKTYRNAADFARADPSVMEQAVRPTGFFRNKARNIIAAARMIEERFGGRVPKTMGELLELPGVARKTANVVLGSAFGIPSGIVVDTHVRRIAQRLGLTRNNDPVRIEQDLTSQLPQSDWILFSFLLQRLGREVCVARKPRHALCVLCSICPSRTI